MKITGLEIHAYSAPHTTPIANGKYTYASTDIVIASVLTDEGITGYGWAHGGNLVIDTLESLQERILGEDPFNVERIWEKMYLPKVYGRKGFATRAISAVDIALWDIIGKTAGRSVHQMLGGYRDSVPAYIAGGYYEADKSFAGLQQEMKDNLAKGARAIKMKIGGASAATDLERIDAVRDVIGPDIELLVDANNTYDRITALRMGRELDRRNIYWFEEPLSPDDLEGCAELCRKIDTPIAVGENEYTRWGFKQLIDAGAAQIINADAQVLGGITEWKKVADLAMAAHILVAPHGDQEIHAHLVGAIPNGLIVEYYDNNTNALKEAMFPKAMHLNGEGAIVLPSEPGLGADPNFEALERFKTYPHS
ncbi:mandelate racemase/muconate lactonizing enzyme family protein [Breznakiella homolactica]|uniref:Mandelate racemase/muconate lactonizing enzyme family protein n=1 Tax=Breznakiella homolactica TaxID=2798577 RepID=A0A7T7XLQ9_9SPIR|nr:mandelate racemase/muconate lactonizing enzyme family protein [Breznakiella homolactica]QQO08621.1 mandelate racemase/muconate lactonizing enzyme family protein [Breznakiella homolactica]